MGKLWAAGGLGILSLVMLMGFFRADVSGVSAALALLISVGLPAAGSGALLYSHFRQTGLLQGRKEKLRRQSLEAEVLRLAAKKDGKLTLAEVISETSVDADRAKAALDALHLRSLAEIELSESGVLVYAFSNVKAIQEKHTAKGVLDV